MTREEKKRAQKEHYEQLNQKMKERREFAYQQNNTFLNKAFNKQLLPSIFISLGYTINAFFDGIIVGQKVGAEAFAAINICMPILLFQCMVGSLIGNGCYLLSSRAIGENNIEKAKKLYNTCFVYSLVLGLVITVLGCVFCKPLCLLLCTGEWNQGVYDYAIVSCAAALPKILLYIPLLFLRLDGKPGVAQICSNAMTIINIVLDILLVSVFDMGLFGASLASAVATLIAVLYGLFVLTKSEIFHLDFKCEKHVLKDICTFGMPSSMNNAMSALRILLLNTAILNFGTMDDLCIFAVINNVSDLALCIVDGVPQTATPILAVYSAENSYNGVKIMMLRQLQYSLMCTTGFGLLITIFANPIGRLFGFVSDNPAAMIQAMLCLAVSTVILGVLRIMIYYYNASGKNVLSIAITILRVVVLPVGFFHLFVHLGQLFWLFLPMSECVCLMILVEGLALYNKKHPNETLFLQIPVEQTLTDDSLEFSLHANNAEICDAVEKMTNYLEDRDIDPKTSMRLSLAIEEMLTLLADECLQKKEEETFDIRVFYSEEKKGIRVRCMGKIWNPLEHDSMEDDKYLGVDMIKNIAKTANYSNVLGVNNLLILI